MNMIKHLALLNDINRRLSTPNKTNVVDKCLIDDMLIIISVDSKNIDEQLLEDKDIEYINLYRKAIEELQEQIFNIKLINSNKIFNKEIMTYERIWQLKMKEIIRYREKYISANGKLESGCMKYDDNSIEMIKKRKEYELAKKEYEAFKLVMDKSYKNYRTKINELSYLLNFKIDAFNEKLIELNNVIANLIFGKIISQNIFRNPQQILPKAYEILVENKMIKYIDFLEFNRVITLNKEFNFVKETGGKGRDKYTAYFVNCMVKYDFLNPTRFEEWEDYMIQKFEIKDYKKKKNPSEENKESLHKKIDKILGIEFIKASNKLKK